MTMENENDLLDFTWDNDNENLDVIFNDDEVVEEQPQHKQEEIVEETTEEEQPTEDLEDLDENKEKTTNKQKSKEDTKQEETSIYKDVYKDLKEYGVLKHVNIDDDEEVDADRLAELYEQDYEEEIKTRINTWASKELDEDAQAFIKFKRAGGKTADFLNIYNKKNSNIPEGDISSEDFQDEVIRYQLKQDDYTDDEIEDELERLTTNGKKETLAKRYYSKLEGHIKKQRDELVYEQEQARKNAQIQEQSFKEGIKEVLTSNKELNGFKITPKEKNQLYSFLTSRTVQIDDNRVITPFQKKLAETFQDTNKLVILAKLLNSDFDMTDFKKSVVTQETKKIKSHLENRKGLKNSSFGSSTGEINLEEIFS